MLLLININTVIKFNASMLNKSTNFFKKKTDPKHLNNIISPFNNTDHCFYTLYLIIELIEII